MMKLKIDFFTSEHPRQSSGLTGHYADGEHWFTDPEGNRVDCSLVEQVPWTRLRLKFGDVDTKEVVELDVSTSAIVHLVEHLRREYPRWFQQELEKCKPEENE